VALSRVRRCARALGGSEPALQQSTDTTSCIARRSESGLTCAHAPHCQVYERDRVTRRRAVVVSYRHAHVHVTLLPFRRMLSTIWDCSRYTLVPRLRLGSLRTASTPTIPLGGVWLLACEPHSWMVQSSAREAIEYLCRLLASFGIDCLTPETIRQAKFRGHAVSRSTAHSSTWPVGLGPHAPAPCWLALPAARAARLTPTSLLRPPQARQPLLRAIHDLVLCEAAGWPPHCAASLRALWQQLQQERLPEELLPPGAAACCAGLAAGCLHARWVAPPVRTCSCWVVFDALASCTSTHPTRSSSVS
jgi:hypothetical protein